MIPPALRNYRTVLKVLVPNVLLKITSEGIRPVIIYYNYCPEVNMIPQGLQDY